MIKLIKKIIKHFKIKRDASGASCQIAPWLSKRSIGYDEILASVKYAKEHGGGWCSNLEKVEEFYYFEPSYYGLCGAKKKYVKLKTRKVVFIALDLDENKKTVHIYDLRDILIPDGYKRVEKR